MSARDGDVFIVCLADAGDAALQSVLARCGLHDPSPRWRRHAPDLLTIRATDPTGELEARLRVEPAVARVVVLRGTRLYSHWPGGRPARVGLANGAGPGAEPMVVAGPCSVEGRTQVQEIAAAVAAAGAHALRGGVFKPRTSPYEFGGLGVAGLELLAEAGRSSGLPIVTEALDLACLDVVAEVADVVQIGSRNMHNASLLFAAGAHPTGRPVLLKRGLGATVEELLEAAEYVLLGRIAAGHGQPDLILCERGIRTFESSVRFTLDVGAIPVLARRTYLPVIVDPSHAAGDRALVRALAVAGLAAGAGGLIVEVHTDPARAWCDGPQSLDIPAFTALMRAMRQLHVDRAAT